MKKEQVNADFIQIEHELLNKWKNENLFDKIKEKNENGNRFRFLDGPITANYRAGIHHIWGRTLKDIAIKYHALQGESCQYQNGFDAQGMWVEVNVEKELGLNGKPEILNYGLDKFTNKCKERVQYFGNEITNQSIRLGQFMDWENSYYTNSNENITSIWAFLKKCQDNGWIIKKHKPMVWCPRCGTSLSEHEMIGSYHDVVHMAIFFKLPIKNKDFKMVGWTTTPWTLSANVALAVNPNLEYVKVKLKSNSENLVLCKNALNILKVEYEIIDTFIGQELIGLEYETCFPELKVQNFKHVVIPWEDVDANEGSGIVHIAPGCGTEDFDLGLKFNLPQICPINEQGIILENYGFLANIKTTECASLVVERLKNDNKLLYSHPYKHSYPFCWRCKTDLVYKLISTWYIKMDDLRPQLIKALDDVTFQPEFGKKRMLDWLNNMGDWNISRARFYGLPLPFYVCNKCGKVHVIGNLDELKSKAINKEIIDTLPSLHRPWIDAIKIKCDCGNIIDRISEVGDCWLDAGITALSTKKFFSDKEYFNNNFPNDFVCEMVEQIKLWFYSLLVMSVVMTGKAPYKLIKTYAYVKDENGNEFHKSGGNSLDCDVVADKVGADTMRYLYADANPTNDMKFGFSLTDDVRKKLMSFWNIYIFFNTYATIDNPNIENYIPNFDKMNITDKWLLERINLFTSNSIKNYQDYNFYLITKEFENLIDDISNFYIRSNRKRFWKSSSFDQMDAYYCLYHALKNIIIIMSPIIPFITDYIWINLIKEVEINEVSSVHLANFPLYDKKFEYGLLNDVKNVKDIIYLALKLRNEEKIKVKQPLQTLYLKCTNEFEDSARKFIDLIIDEVNVKKVEFVKDDNKFNDKILSLNFKNAGRVLKGEVNNVKAYLENLKTDEMIKYVDNVELNKSISLHNYGVLSPDLFEVKLVTKNEYSIAQIDNNLVVLDIKLTKDLIEEGNLRELIRQIQVLRKEAGFDIVDRIYIDFKSSDSYISMIIDKFKELIKSETLTLDIKKLDCFDYENNIEVADKTIKIKLKKA